VTSPFRQVYSRRRVPRDGAQVGPWLETELLSVQRSVAPPRTFTVTAAYTATQSDGLILVDCTAAGVTVTIPDPVKSQGQRLNIKKIDATVNVVTIGGTVDNTLNPTIVTQYVSLELMSDGTSWWFV